MEKKPSFLSTFTTVFAVGVFSATVSIASPTLVMPSNADLTWVTASAGYNIEGINATQIDYGTLMASKQLYGGVYYGENSTGAIQGGVTFTDPATMTGTVTTTVTNLLKPDIIIGNKSGSSNFIAAVVYIAKDSLKINYYDVVYSGVTFSVSLHSSVLVTTTGISPSCVPHIDVIAQTTNTGTTGFAFCDTFAVVWDDYSGATPVVKAARGILNSYTSSFTPVTITPSGTSGYSPDITAVQKRVGTAIHDYAWVTYIGNATDKILLNTWDMATGSVGAAAVTLEGGASPVTAVAVPRIDAYDNYNSNSSMTNANYKVVAQVDSSGFQVIRVYDDVLGAGNHWQSSIVVDLSSAGLPAPPYNHFSPTIAFGHLNLSSWDVLHYTEYVSSGTHDDVMEYPLSTSSSTSLMGTHYYMTNFTAPVTAANNYPNAVCTAPNQPSDRMLVAWAVNASGTYKVMYKTELAYAFRSASNEIGNVNGNEDIKVYPNPAANYFIIDNPDDADVADAYTISDMSGRVVQNGQLIVGKQNVFIDNLTQGNYIITVSNNGKIGGSIKFVKQ